MRDETVMVADGPIEWKDKIECIAPVRIFVYFIS